MPENTTLMPPGTNLCIVQRTAFDNGQIANEFVNNIRSSGISLIVDTDDAFHVIDPAHPEHAEHRNRVAALDLVISQADKLWLSVPQLKKHLPESHTPAEIMRNNLDPRVWEVGRSKKQLDAGQTKPLQLLYMGTVSHDADLDMIMPALERIIKKNPGSLELSIIGVSTKTYDQPWVKRFYQKRGGSIYPKFVSWLLQQGPFDIGLSPLVENEFNNCKSDIKCLDYIAAGVLPVVSDIEPYRNPELNDYIVRIKNTVSSWEESLANFASDPEKTRRDIREIIPKAQDYLWEKRSSEITAKKMLDQFDSLKNT